MLRIQDRYRPFLLLLLCLLPISIFSQNAAYADVAVIVNDNDSTSLGIGNYYAQVRGISANRILHVQVPVAEETDSLGFEDLRAQIEAELMLGNLLDTINYLVTTKGLPLRVSIRSACDSVLAHQYSGNTIGRCTSVESELTLILGNSSAAILQPQYAPNPYSGSLQAFDRDSFQMFLVSRLDGNTLTDVEILIDRGGPGNTYYPPQSNFLMDAYQVGQNLSGFFNAVVIPQLDARINDLGLNIVKDSSDQVFVGDQTDLIGYANFMIDTIALASNTYQNGAMVFAGLENSCYSFNAGGSLVAGNTAGRVIAAGAPLVAGMVAAGYFSSGTQPSLLFDFYLDSTQSLPTNAATAFYRASNLVSGQSILIGDPKTAIERTWTASAEGPIANELDNMQLYPNPNQGEFKVKGNWKTKGAVAMKVFAATGQVVYERSETASIGEFEYAINLSGLSSGIYYLKVTQGMASQSKKFVLISE